MEDEHRRKYSARKLWDRYYSQKYNKLYWFDLRMREDAIRIAHESTNLIMN